MGHPFDRGIGDQVADVVEFGGTGLVVAVCHRPDGATVQIDSVVMVVDLVRVGQVSLLIKEIGQGRYSFVDLHPCEFRGRLFSESSTSSFKDPGNKFWIFLVDMVEELYRQAAVAGDEEIFGQFGGVITIGGASGLATILASGDENPPNGAH